MKSSKSEPIKADDLRKAVCKMRMDADQKAEEIIRACYPDNEWVDLPQTALFQKFKLLIVEAWMEAHAAGVTWAYKNFEELFRMR